MQVWVFGDMGVGLPVPATAQLWASAPIRPAENALFRLQRRTSTFAVYPAPNALPSGSRSLSLRSWARGDSLYVLAQASVKSFNPRPCARGDGACFLRLCYHIKIYLFRQPSSLCFLSLFNAKENGHLRGLSSPLRASAYLPEIGGPLGVRFGLH